VYVKDVDSCVHVASFRQGLDAQTFTKISQNVPVVTIGQLQSGPVCAEKQIPPFKHGFNAQKSIFFSQFVPVYPTVHWHM
jgi:hypothetical protein